MKRSSVGSHVRVQGKICKERDVNSSYPDHSEWPLSQGICIDSSPGASPFHKSRNLTREQCFSQWFFFVLTFSECGVRYLCHKICHAVKLAQLILKMSKPRPQDWEKSQTKEFLWEEKCYFLAPWIGTKYHSEEVNGHSVINSLPLWCSLQISLKDKVSLLYSPR